MCKIAKNAKFSWFYVYIVNVQKVWKNGWVRINHFFMYFLMVNLASPLVREIPVFVHLSIYARSIRQKSFVFQNTLQNEKHSRNRYANRFGNITHSISAITFFNYFPDFEDIWLACYSYKSAIFCCIFDGLCACQKYFSPSMNCLVGSDVTHTLLPIPNKNLHHRTTEFCANFNTSSNFLVFSTRFPNIFTTVVNDWLC